MVNTDDMLEIQQQSQEPEKEMKLAKVVSLFETGTAKIQFYGEDTPSEKEYSYLASYKPQINDIVLMIPFADSYIIAGRVLFQMVLDNSIVTEDMLNEILANYVTSETATSFITQTDLDNTLTGYSPTSHKHNELYYGGNSYRVGLFYTYNNVPQFVPSSSNVGLGASSYKWKEVYAVTGTINTSDLRKKNSIEALPQKYKELFRLLKPVIYKMNDGTSDRYHVGFISQHIEESMQEIGMDSKEFAGFIKSPALDNEGNEIDGEYDYSLRYTEFIPLNTAMIQEQQKIIDEQQKTISNLIIRLEKLEAKVGESIDTSDTP